MPRDGKRLVLIAGGGVAALEAMVALSQTAGDLVEVELVSPDRDFYYRPLSVGEPRTSRNTTFDYDDLLIAIGARPREAVPGALTFRGGIDVPLIRGLLDDIDRGRVERTAFALPGGASWPVPLYELALLTAHHARSKSRTDLEITIATPEERPLGLLGHQASDTVASQLKEHGIQFLPMTYPESYVEGELRIVPGPPLQVDAVVTLPRLRGVPLAGVPQNEDYFIPVDASGRVRGLEDVFAAGDITTFPVKQGGLAAQQADVAATEIAAAAGADIVPESFEPVLRGLLLSSSPLFLRAELGGGHGPASLADPDALWWPAAKIASRFLSPYLAEHAGFAYGARGGPASLL